MLYQIVYLIFVYSFFTEHQRYLKGNRFLLNIYVPYVDFQWLSDSDSITVTRDNNGFLYDSFIFLFLYYHFTKIHSWLVIF